MLKKAASLLMMCTVEFENRLPLGHTRFLSRRPNPACAKLDSVGQSPHQLLLMYFW